MFENLKDNFFKLIDKNLKEASGDEKTVVPLISAYLIFLEEKISNGELKTNSKGEVDHNEAKLKYDFMDRATKCILGCKFWDDKPSFTKTLRKKHTPTQLYEFLDIIGQDIYSDINFNEPVERHISIDICSLLAFDVVTPASSFLNETSIEEINNLCDLFKDRYKMDYFDYDESFFPDKESFFKFLSTLSKRQKEEFLLLKEKAEECYLSSNDYRNNLSKSEIELLDIARLYSIRYTFSMCTSDEIRSISKKCTKYFEDTLLEEYDLSCRELDSLELLLSNFVQSKIDTITLSEINDINDFIQSNLDDILSFVRKNLNEINSILEFIHKYTKNYIKNMNLILDATIKDNPTTTFRKKLISIKKNNDIGFYWMWSIIENIKDLILFYMNYFVRTVFDMYNTQLEQSNKEHNTINLEISNFNIDTKLNKILSYKQLNKIANNNGFQKLRQNGDHGIFKNENGDLIVIPQGRAIGKGLNLKIQKDIYNINRNY